MSSICWRKSSHSTSDQACLEISAARDVIHVRDAQAPQRGYFSTPIAAWAVYIAAIKAT